MKAMNDLISRQDVINAVLGSNFSACTVYGRSEEGMATAKELIQTIKNLPSAQPERKKGKWTREVLGSTSGYGTTTMYQCSVCECMEIEQYDYCPNCGADMRGGENDGK